MIELKTPDGQFVRYWKGNSQHVLIYLHGVQSHSDWMVPSSEEFSRRSITVYAPDRRGSGRSGAARGDLQDFRDLLEDLRSLIRFVREREPRKNLHLAALCWGARIALPVSLDPDLGVSSFVLVSPGLYTSADYPFFTKLRIAWASLAAPQKKFRLPLADEWFTQNPVYLDFIRRDSLGLRQVTARFLRETVRLNIAARQAFKKVTLPLFVMLAGQDRIVDVPKTEQKFKTILNPRKQLKIYPGWQHSLEFEKNNQPFFDDLLKWFEIATKNKP